MKFEKDKKNKNGCLVVVSMNFVIHMTDKEVDDGTEIPHEMIVAGCVDCLSNKEYEVEEYEAD